MSVIRIFGLVLLTLMLTTLSGWAQTSETETPTPVTEPLVAAVETPAASTPPQTDTLLDTIDFNDPAIIAAIAAREDADKALSDACLLYTSPSPRDGLLSRMPSSA